MNKETLLAELNRLLDLGEPLLTAFPKKRTVGWAGGTLQLPDNISDEMGWYADDVAWRAWDRKGFRESCRLRPTSYLVGLIERRKVGLLGWRAIGVL